MADSKLQREYTLADALCNIAVGGAQDDTAKVERASQWVGTLVRDLEAKAEVAAMVVRVAVTEVRPGDALVFTLRDATDLEYDGYLHYLNTLKQLVARELGHPVPVLLVDGADVSVLRTVQDAGRCLLGFPSSNGKFVCRCTLPACHDGQHDNGNGDTWPKSEPTQIKEDESPSDVPAWQKTLDSVASGQPAPEHLSEGRLAQDGEAVCARQPLDLHANPSQRPTCAREMWHTGPHMDRTAIAHAGKAGEVWT